MEFLKLAELVWERVVMFLERDVLTLSRLSLCSKSVHEFVRRRKYWIEYYKSITVPRNLITKDSVHVGPQTFFSCGIGAYPGWENIHDIIPVSFMRCTRANHYTQTVEAYPSIRYRNMFMMCARKTFVKDKKKVKWTSRDEQRLKHFRDQVRKLEERKERVCDLYSKFYVHLTHKQKKDYLRTRKA